MRASHEPSFACERVQFDAWLHSLLQAAGSHRDRPAVVAVDGRSGAGKSTLADRISARVPDAAIVHTDDLAWEHSATEWGDLLRAHVLEPLRSGHAIDYRPPGWVRMGRDGAVVIPSERSLVVVEGVGAIRDEVDGLLDASVWVQSEAEEAKRRTIARDLQTGQNGDESATLAFWDWWQSEEEPFLERQRPWDRATTVTAGTPSFSLAADEIAAWWRT